MIPNMVIQKAACPSVPLLSASLINRATMPGIKRTVAMRYMILTGIQAGFWTIAEKFCRLISSHIKIPIENQLTNNNKAQRIFEKPENL